MSNHWKLAVGIAAVGGALAMVGLGGPGSPRDNLAAIDLTLDAMHEFAAKADEDRYFDLYTPDAIFLGTDATERWTIEQFKEYAMPIFTQREVGWVYTPTSRHIILGAGGDTAWFDETLVNAKYGACRGSGVLVKTAGGWKIAQYNLTVPIPNDLLEQVAGMIREHENAAP